MKKEKKIVKKLALHRETLQGLADVSLIEAHGGIVTINGNSCTPLCPTPHH